jgi:hypothetical protein
MGTMSQRRKLSGRGRVIAAGVSIGAAGVLAAAMAISDNTASASPAPAISASTGSPSPDSGYQPDDRGSTYTPSTPSSNSGSTGSSSTPSQQPQPHTRSGGS